MLVELAIGDAYGAAFEYAPERIIREQNTVSGYVYHPRHNFVPGSYTDDTQMSIAVAEAIVSGERWTPKLLARHFVTAFKRDPREGYARQFYQFLHSVEDEDDFLKRIRPHSEKSGAAMRACPIGVFPTVGTVMERATIQARITHDTPTAIDSAVAVALMTHYGLYELGPRSELDKFIDSLVPGPWQGRWTGEVGPRGIDAAHAALTTLITHDSLASILRAAIAFGGDTDTVATIALGAASCFQDVQKDLPQVLFDNLENGSYGREYLEGLDNVLLNR